MRIVGGEFLGVFDVVGDVWYEFGEKKSVVGGVVGWWKFYVLVMYGGLCNVYCVN